MKVALLMAVTYATWCVVQGGEHPDGESQVSRSQDALGNYHFSYKVANDEGEQFREEGTDASGRVIGSYGLTHVDGSHRVVDYVADKNGFRAAVRSNEHGLASAEAAGLTIVKTDQHIPLSVAATSDDESRHVFGRRIDAHASKVEYVDKDEEAKEQRNFDDYRPLNPVAYYPTDFRSNPSSAEQPRSPRKLTPSNSEADSKPLDVYFPPIDPHTAARRPPYYGSRDRTSINDFPTTTSRKPYIPPYGGFDDDEDPVPPIERKPGVGLRPSHVALGPPVVNPVKRFPPVEHRNFDVPRFPPTSLHPRPPLSALPPQNPPVPSFIPQSPPAFNPPSYDGRIGVPTVVLRAVPIPNGIQAVRVDPTTGRIYERLVYPLYLRHDGRPEYDRNMILHNDDDVSDDDELRHDEPVGYPDSPFQRGPFRGVRNQPPYGDDGRRFSNSSYNQSNRINANKLSEPSSADVSWIKKQLALVEGFDEDHFADRFLPNHIPDIPDRDRFDEDRYGRRVPSSRLRSDSSNYSNDSDYNRDDLASEGSKTHAAKLEEKVGSKSETDEQNDSESKL